MKQIKSWLLFCMGTFGFYTVLSLPAFADQCAYISKEQASKAIARLDLDDRVYFLCEPCGEEVPKLTQIESLSAGTVDYRDFWQVNINGKGIDLAYVFVDSGIENNFANLAAIADCPAQRVSPVLPLGESERNNQLKIRDYHEGS